MLVTGTNLPADIALGGTVMLQNWCQVPEVLHAPTDASTSIHLPAGTSTSRQPTLNRNTYVSNGFCGQRGDCYPGHIQQAGLTSHGLTQDVSLVSSRLFQLGFLPALCVRNFQSVKTFPVRPSNRWSYNTEPSKQG